MKTLRSAMDDEDRLASMAAPFHWRIFGGLTLSLVALGLSASVAYGQVEEEAEAVVALPATCAVSATDSRVLECSNACDVVITPDNLPADVEIIRLTESSACDPAIDGAGQLIEGDGIAIEANNVTLDLNGQSITSTADIAAIGAEQGFDVENAGVAIGGTGVTVTNSSPTTVSVVDNFTANYDLSTRGDAGGTTFRGMLIDDDGDPATPEVYNLVGGNAHGGGAMAIDRSHNLTVDTVMLKDTTGDNGMDLKRCTGGDVTITNSHIEGQFTGLRIRDCEDVMVSDSTLTSIEAGAGVGVEVIRVKESTFTDNTIKDNAVGVSFRGSENITIANNTFANNSVCDVDLDADSKDTTIGSNQPSSSLVLDANGNPPPLPAGSFSEQALCLGGQEATLGPELD